MKTIILLAVILTTVASSASTQTLEHFKVETNENSLTIHPTFDSLPTSGVNGLIADPSESIAELIKNAFKTLPKEIKEAIKKEIKNNKIWATYFFNSNGEIFYIYFDLIGKEKIFLNDQRWLILYNTIRPLKIDLSKLMLADNFEWGCITHPILSLFIQ